MKKWSSLAGFPGGGENIPKSNHKLMTIYIKFAFQNSFLGELV
jgi:hypothetical protein